MTVAKLRACKNGHQFYKGSDCPTCPLCEEERKPSEGFLSLLVAPARRALESNGITTLEKLSKYSEAEVLGLHGVGPSTMPKLKELLREQGMKFRKID
jgi:predicted RecB family nuclease